MLKPWTFLRKIITDVPLKKYMFKYLKNVTEEIFK